MQYAETPIKDAIEIVQDITCPDQGTCPDETTCCKDTDGGYNCCPAPNANCCKDRVNCCPQAMPCCRLGCCPIPYGICCNDPGGHCCPPGSRCNPEHGGCLASPFLPILMGLPEFNNNDLPMEKVLIMHNSFCSYSMNCGTNQSYMAQVWQS